MLEVLYAVIAAGALVTFVAVSALIFIWAERKVSGRIQDRLGPTRVGGKFGWLQTVADGVKLLVKEDFIPTVADGFLFRLAPYVAFCGSFVAFMALPFGNYFVAAREINISVFFMLAVMSSEVFGVIMAGYGSGSKWALFGGIREAAQVVSYEVPRAICVLLPVMLAGTLDLNVICQRQAGWIWNWYVFHDPFTFAGFWVFFTCATASCKRAPFDLAEAESELVAGFHTEYSGLRWSLFFMAEYGSMFAVSAIAALLFLGGWHTGILPFEPTEFFGKALGPTGGFIVGNLLNVTVFIIKGYLLVVVMMWVRWTLPRLRIDQVMTTCLKYLLPISCVLLIGLTMWQLIVPPAVKYYLPCLLAPLALVPAVLLLVKAITAPAQKGLLADDLGLCAALRLGTPMHFDVPTLFFYVIAAVVGASALMVVVTQNIVRSAIWLMFTLVATSILYFQMGADFVGATQLIVYVGGTLVLVVFGVMLTAQGPFVTLKTGAAEWAIAVVSGFVFLGVLVAVTSGAKSPSPATPGPTVEQLGHTFLGITEATATADLTGMPEGKAPVPRQKMSYLLPFELVSVHLLVVLIGAAYLARAKRRPRASA